VNRFRFGNCSFAVTVVAFAESFDIADIVDIDKADN
jgi:hypothetical protein